MDWVPSRWNWIYLIWKRSHHNIASKAASCNIIILNGPLSYISHVNIWSPCFWMKRKSTTKTNRDTEMKKEVSKLKWLTAALKSKTEHFPGKIAITLRAPTLSLIFIIIPEQSFSSHRSRIKWICAIDRGNGDAQQQIKSRNLMLNCRQNCNCSFLPPSPHLTFSGLADVSHYSHYRRWCTFFFKPVPLFA